MRYYYAIVHKDADSAFGVTFPDLPGCFSAADTMEDIVPRACDALELWFEDQQETTPRTIDEIRDLAKDDLAAGAFIVAVPRIENDHRIKRVNLSLESGILDAIDRAAAQRNLTRSAFIAQGMRTIIEARC